MQPYLSIFFTIISKWKFFLKQKKLAKTTFNDEYYKKIRTQKKPIIWTSWVSSVLSAKRMSNWVEVHKPFRRGKVIMIIICILAPALSPTICWLVVSFPTTNDSTNPLSTTDSCLYVWCISRYACQLPFSKCICRSGGYYFTSKAGNTIGTVKRKKGRGEEGGGGGGNCKKFRGGGNFFVSFA